MHPRCHFLVDYAAMPRNNHRITVKWTEEKKSSISVLPLLPYLQYQSCYFNPFLLSISKAKKNGGGFLIAKVGVEDTSAKSQFPTKLEGGHDRHIVNVSISRRLVQSQSCSVSNSVFSTHHVYLLSIAKNFYSTSYTFYK